MCSSDLHYTFYGAPCNLEELSAMGSAYSGIAIVERAPRSVASKKHTHKQSMGLWHCRFGHMSPACIKTMVDKNMVKGIDGYVEWSRGPCNVCASTKLKPAGRKFIGGLRSTAPLQPIHVDNVEGFTCKSFGNKTGHLFVGDYSRAKFFYPVKKKSDFLQVLQQLITKLSKANRTVSSVRINAIQSDWASELSAGKTKQWCDQNGIMLQHSSPGSHKENGIVEKSIDVVKSAARAIMANAGFPAEFWVFAMLAACHVLMFWPTKITGKTPYESLFNHTLDVSH